MLFCLAIFILPQPGFILHKHSYLAKSILYLKMQALRVSEAERRSFYYGKRKRNDDGRRRDSGWSNEGTSGTEWYQHEHGSPSVSVQSRREVRSYFYEWQDW